MTAFLLASYRFLSTATALTFVVIASYRWLLFRIILNKTKV
jgi:hypothetical protein